MSKRPPSERAGRALAHWSRERQLLVSPPAQTLSPRSLLSLPRVLLGLHRPARRRQPPGIRRAHRRCGRPCHGSPLPSGRKRHEQECLAVTVRRWTGHHTMVRTSAAGSPRTTRPGMLVIRPCPAPGGLTDARRRVHESAAEPRVRAPFDGTCSGLVKRGRRRDCATDARGSGVDIRAGLLKWLEQLPG
jgi:hypothetical protein